jgi:hypothetical protein
MGEKAGMPLRLYKRDAVKRGEWYYAIDCGRCGELIYALDDAAGGREPSRLAGIGDISIACPKCAHEGTYPAADLKVVRAVADVPGSRPERAPTSKSSRKPLARSYPNARATFGVGFIEDRPKAAAIVARIITGWADVEVECARLLAELMGTNIPAAAAVFGSLRSSRAQHDALAAAAEAVLDAADFDLFSAHMTRRASLEKERNDLAHGCFGVSVGIPEHIVWVAQGDYLRSVAGDFDFATFRSKQFVYQLGTLERIAQEIEEFYHQLAFFRGYLWSRQDGDRGASFRRMRYPQLRDQPHIREHFARGQSAKSSQPSGKKKR